MKKRNPFALKVMTSILLMVFIIIIINSFLISIIGYHYNSTSDLKIYAANVSTKESVLQAKRGLILDSEHNIIAQDVESYTLYAIVDSNRPSYQNKPSYVVDKKDTAQKLAGVLDASYEYIYSRLEQASYQTEFGVFGSKLSQEKKDEIDSLNLPGLGFAKTYTRDYPLDVFASNLIGFVGEDETSHTIIGKMGIEANLNDRLAGVDGQKTSVVDRFGYTLPGYSSAITAQQDGSTIQLTIHKTLQEQLESSFLMTQETFDASEIFGGIMEVDTGKILALGQYPSFSPNLLDVKEFKNFATQYVYEPGSTMKSFTYSAAIDSGVYVGEASFNSNPFLVSLDAKGEPYRNLGNNALVIGTIRNAHNKSWGSITYNEGFAYSSNVGIASLLTTKLDLSVFQEYLIRFGFNESVDIYGLSESIGRINFEWPFDKLTVGFGQGITVNMMQIMQAYTAIFNNGNMVKPYVIENISNPATNEIEYQANVKIIGQPISSESAHELQDLMYRVTQNEPTPGTARAYNIEGLNILAKTGTAQIFENGEYLDDEYLYSVVIALPAENPKVMLYYAYRAPSTLNAHFNTEAVQQILKSIARTYSLREEDQQKIIVNNSELQSFSLPNLMNHSLDYSLTLLNNYTNKVVVLGRQNSILDQYPNANEAVLNNQIIFLKTDTSDFEMINLVGLSLKDAKAFASLVNVKLSYEGEGQVLSQSIEVGENLNNTLELYVVLG